MDMDYGLWNRAASKADSKTRFQFQNLSPPPGENGKVAPAPQKAPAKKLDKFKYKLETILFLLVLGGWIAMVTVFFVRGEPGQGYGDGWKLAGSQAVF